MLFKLSLSFFLSGPAPGPGLLRRGAAHVPRPPRPQAEGGRPRRGPGAGQGQGEVPARAGQGGQEAAEDDDGPAGEGGRR